MKYVFIFALLLCGCSTGEVVSTEPEVDVPPDSIKFLHQNSILTSFSTSMADEDIDEFYVRQDAEVKSFELAGEVQFLPHEMIGIGLGLSASNTKITVEADPLDPLNFPKFQQSTKNSSVYLVGYLYFLPDKSNPFQPFIRLAAGEARGRIEQKSLGIKLTEKDTASANAISIGALYFLNDHVAVKGLIGRGSISWDKDDYMGKRTGLAGGVGITIAF